DYYCSAWDSSLSGLF
nr:immunoglobulin light chain junction region [Macaca mulatta]MOW07703.1 immunoglobulin light chain junction region [Macaca mulatta]